MQECLTINIRLGDIHCVESEQKKVVMILFDGDADCENFKGRVLSGGVDTQHVDEQDTCNLSARYMLEGVDCEGNPCKLFIENNGTSVPGEAVMKTVPQIFTDSPALKWMEKAELTGEVWPAEGGVTIRIYTK